MPIANSFSAHTSAPVIIAGAGPTGLSLAPGLARYGVRSIVCEKDAALKPHSRAILVTARTLDIFQEWNILTSFRESGIFQETFMLHDARTSCVVLNLAFDVSADVLAEPGILMISQDVTERLLLEAVRSTGLCDVRFDIEVAQIQLNAAGS